MPKIVFVRQKTLAIETGIKASDLMKAEQAYKTGLQREYLKTQVLKTSVPIVTKWCIQLVYELQIFYKSLNTKSTVEEAKYSVRQLL